MTMVLACGLSMPVSMMVEHSSTLKRCAVKSRITRSRSRSRIWPCATAMRAFGQQLLQPFAHALDGVDLVVQEVHLAAAAQLAQHRLADQALGPGGDEGLDRQALLRRGGDHRKVADSFQRHRERARDRRRGQRQHVDLGAQLLQRLLLAHAEAMLLVDDHQAEALELDVARQQLVRADDDVDLAGFELADGLRGLLRAPEAGQFRDLHRPVGEAVAEGLEMLLGEQRGRAEDHHLLAVGDRDERGAQRDLGLAEADVAAHQAVHRLAGRHVGDHRLDRRRLVGGLLEAEAVGERFQIVLLEWRTSGPGVRRASRTATAIRRRCRAPAARRAPSPCPTGRCPACAAALPRAARRCSGRSRRAARPARRACRRPRTRAAGIPCCRRRRSG